MVFNTKWGKITVCHSHRVDGLYTTAAQALTVTAVHKVVRFRTHGWWHPNAIPRISVDSVTPIVKSKLFTHDIGCFITQWNAIIRFTANWGPFVSIHDFNASIVRSWSQKSDISDICDMKRNQQMCYFKGGPHTLKRPLEVVPAPVERYYSKVSAYWSRVVSSFLRRRYLCSVFRRVSKIFMYCYCWQTLMFKTTHLG